MGKFKTEQIQNLKEVLNSKLSRKCSRGRLHSGWDQVRKHGTKKERRTNVVQYWWLGRALGRQRQMRKF